MDSIEFFAEQARECRAAASKGASREERHGFEQLARHYEREVARVSRPATPQFGERARLRA